MHKLIDASIVDHIRSTGNTSPAFPDRIPILEKHNLPFDRYAENVVISGCQILPTFPQLLGSLARIFDRKGLSYTFLSKEFCCGNNLYRPAIKEKNDEAMAECRTLSAEFVWNNIRQARDLGAKRIIIFCSPCFPIYRYAFPDENIIFYPAAIDELFEPMEVRENIDYYPGCYRLHRKFAPVAMDLDSTEKVLGKMAGLAVNRIGAPRCCFHPDGLAHMIGGVKTKTMLHVCTGCYGQALLHMPPDKGVDVMMLPDFVERVMKSHGY
jgi:hypothetical protein